ncbi:MULTISPECIES: ArsR family transcriptional regulator [Mycobacterium]|uniref:ArsR family transcriptional regulator n=1 Tax=Mycobacterium colombiense TaxID=339268 RepID=A0A329LSC6_9MYCO|nr:MULTISPECIES: ArsR family transcriptional regulator [Mycobacterium]MDM4141947.1 ArsR family transcriptional regulator [Mycobacterium sp. FLAC0960]RAV10835.1 ArsR family transcriptional regulator [Mycobacterium colombiense]
MATADRADVPPVLQLAAHPLRWALLSQLASGDHRVRELAAAVGEPQNLVSYHLRLLRSAGLVDARRSSFDGRDTYYWLNLTKCATAFREAAGALHPALAPGPPVPVAPRSVLFLCTGNSARSPMAAALLEKRGQGRIRTASAGSHPKPDLHVNAIRVMRDEYGIDLSGARPKSLAAVSRRRFDCVITLCDTVREYAHEHDLATTMHWSLPDPSAAGGGYPQFLRVAGELSRRVSFLVPDPSRTGGRR